MGRYAGSNGTMTQTGGTLTLSSSVGFEMAEDSGAVGAYTLGGTGQISAPGLGVGNGGTGTFTQNGGTFTTNGWPERSSARHQTLSAPDQPWSSLLD